MPVKRGPFEGVWNVVRFNWPFFVAAAVAATLGIVGLRFLDGWLFWLALAALCAGVGAVLVSLVASYWIYDASGLYDLACLKRERIGDGDRVLNVNAGFDESSCLLRERWLSARLAVFDFYDAEAHTEASARRARLAYPPDPATERISTTSLPLDDGSVRVANAFFSLHEIRDREERVTFLKEIARVLHPEGRLYVTEHLRDLSNALVYTMGVMHFHAKAEWHACFEEAGLEVLDEVKHTPFVSIFILGHGDSG